MKSALAIPIVCFALFALPASARPPSGAVEDTHELEPRMITLPSRSDGTLAVQGCTACERHTYAMSPAVRFYIDEAEVTYDNFKRHVSAHPDAVILLVTPVNQNVITRLTAL
jgi:hypothetical protein